jgi:hypothetical protein
MFFSCSAVVSSLFVFEVGVVCVGGYEVGVLQPGLWCHLVAYLKLDIECVLEGIECVLEEVKGIFQGFQ